ATSAASARTATSQARQIFGMAGILRTRHPEGTPAGGQSWGCGLSCAAFALSEWLGEKFEAARERLRDHPFHDCRRGPGSHVKKRAAIRQIFVPRVTPSG